MSAARTVAPVMPPIAELDALARAYEALVDRSTAPNAAPMFVSLAAGKQYLHQAGYRQEAIETARRDLTEILLDARPSQTDPTLWRARRRSSGVDISARVVQEGRLLIVTVVNARER